jgi:multidrug efflux pump subunit AcrB
VGLVLFALRRPTTIFVIVLAILITSYFAWQRLRADIFPDLGEPVIYISQPYGGLDPAQMDGFTTYYYEYHLLYVSGVKQIESKSIQGAALVKITFHPGTEMSSALSQVVAYSNRSRAFMPPGAVPPFITRFDVGSVAIGQLVFSSQTRSVPEMQDFAINRVRPLFATIPGVSAPPPFGGAQRTILVRLDPDKLRQYRVSPEEVIAAVGQHNVVAPSGVLRTGDLTRIASTNATVAGNLSDLARAPLRRGAGTPVYIGDVATVENGSDLITGYAHVDSKRTVYIPITKRADASSLDVMRRVRAELPTLQAAVPEDVDVRIEFDQTGFVERSLDNLKKEILLGAGLTGLMVLIFLRDWRSALIVLTTIPVSLLSAVIALWATGQTINIMTLAGLALAVGVLVDEATVEVENIHSELDRGTEREQAVRLACARTAIPRLLSMISILAVFVPSFFMSGVAQQLFVPLSLAVAFSMIASYLLSSTLVPVLARKLMKAHPASGEPVFKMLYRRYLEGVKPLRWAVAGLYLLVCGALLWMLLPRLGLEIFPQTAPQSIRLRVFAPTGTRVERTEILALRALDVLKETLGPDRVALTTSYVGTHASSYPVSLIHLFLSGPHEAVLTLALNPGPPINYGQLRDALAKQTPELRVLFEGGDIIEQVMGFGSPTPVNVSITGPNLAADREFARKIEQELSKLPFLRDLQFLQPDDYPTMDLTIDRDRAGQFGLTTADVTRSLVAATSSSRFIEPNYWRDPASGNAFQVQVEVAPHLMGSERDLAELPLAKPGHSQPLVGDVVSMKPGKAYGMIERFNGQKLVSLVANLEGMTLGRAQPLIEEAVQKAGEPPRGVVVRLRGQIPPLTETIEGLETGLLIALGSVFLLLTAFFQSFRLGLAVLLMAPAIATGSVLMMLATGTTLNIQSYLGMIMALGIAMANSILYVSFVEQGSDGSDRLRPIVMTAMAMMGGMLPLALGSDQAAPLGRAVIGGLLAATVATLFVLPAWLAILRKEKAG